MTDSASGGSEFVGKAMPDRAVEVYCGDRIEAPIRIRKRFSVNCQTSKVPTHQLHLYPYLTLKQTLVIERSLTLFSYCHFLIRSD
jgi:hypothetical protein